VIFNPLSVILCYSIKEINVYFKRSNALFDSFVCTSLLLTVCHLIYNSCRKHIIDCLKDIQTSTFSFFSPFWNKTTTHRDKVTKACECFKTTYFKGSHGLKCTMDMMGSRANVYRQYLAYSFYLLVF
jgi:hypothetical protein